MGLPGLEPCSRCKNGAPRGFLDCYFLPAYHAYCKEVDEKKAPRLCHNCFRLKSQDEKSLCSESGSTK